MSSPWGCLVADAGLVRAAARLGVTPAFLREVLDGEGLPHPKQSPDFRAAVGAAIRQHAGALRALELSTSVALSEIADHYEEDLRA